MPTYVFALRPEKTLFERIIDLKMLAKQHAGEQLYLDDEPHITLYVAELAISKEWLEIFKKTLSNKLVKEKFSVSGWHIFKSDAITGSDTLVCEMSENSISALKNIQIAAVQSLARYRTEGIPKRYSDVYQSLPAISKKCLDTYGYPFIGDNWKPHISIASFKKESLKKVWPSLKEMCPIGEYHPEALVVYELGANEKLNKLGEIAFR